MKMINVIRKKTGDFFLKGEIFFNLSDMQIFRNLIIMRTECKIEGTVGKKW